MSDAKTAANALRFIAARRPQLRKTERELLTQVTAFLDDQAREAVIRRADALYQKTETALEEAQRLVHGPRNQDYGSPAEDWGRIAAMARALFGWEKFSATDAALFMILVKLSRERNRPKRDNRVDIAGYAEVVDWIHRDQEATK